MSGNFDQNELNYGYYPQKAVPKVLQEILEQNYLSISLEETGKIYTTDSRKYNDYDKEFFPQSLKEYKYRDRKFVRVKVNSCFDGNKFMLSNGEEYQDGDYVWIEVLPIKWIILKNSLLSRDILFAGVQFNRERNYQGNFKETDIYRFLDQCFSKEITHKKQEVNIQTLENTKLRKKNPYNLSFENLEEEDIIKGAIESGIGVFLHGLSGDGKSARIKQLDPNCEILSLGTLTPDLLVGMAIKDNDEKKVHYIAPPWYTRIVEKCEKEPDKIHLLFLDELTNASPNMQKYAYSIALDKKVNDYFELPKNCRIVAAGNEEKESSVASKLAQPLFDRFAHVYIKTTTEKWLEWANSPQDQCQYLPFQEQPEEMRIHPAIYAYIAYKSYKGEEVLRTKYTGERPNATPRKWEMASKILYRTKNPKMLRALVGAELTSDFCAFCNQRVINIEDVLNKNYTENDLIMDASEQYMTAVGLSICKEEEVEEIRNFLFQLSPEIVAMFDSLWTHGDLERLEKIAQLRMKKEGGIQK